MDENLRSVIEIRGLPNLKEGTTLTVIIPANAGPTFTTELTFPRSMVSEYDGGTSQNPESEENNSDENAGGETEQNKNPLASQSLPLMMASARPPSNPLMTSSMGSPPLMGSPENTLANTIANPLLSGMSPAVQAVSAKSPSSPGRRTLSIQAVTQPLLPSIHSPQSGTPSSYVRQLSRSATPFASELSAPDNTPFVSSNNTPVGSPMNMIAAKPQTGQQLLTQFLSQPASTVISNTVPVVPPATIKKASSAPVNPTLGRPGPSNLSQVLTSQKIMSPSRFNSSSVNIPKTTFRLLDDEEEPEESNEEQKMEQPQMNQAQTDEMLRNKMLSDQLQMSEMLRNQMSNGQMGSGQNVPVVERPISQQGGMNGAQPNTMGTNHQSGLGGMMLPKMEVYKCSPATERSQGGCELVYRSPVQRLQSVNL